MKEAENSDKYLILAPRGEFVRFLQYELESHGKTMQWDVGRAGSEHSDASLLLTLEKFSGIIDASRFCQEDASSSKKDPAGFSLSVRRSLIGSDCTFCNLLPFSDPLSFFDASHVKKIRSQLIDDDAKSVSEENFLSPDLFTNSFFIRLGILLDSTDCNPLTLFLRKARDRRSIKIVPHGPFPLISCRIAAKMSAKALISCSWDPKLLNFYDLSANGMPSSKEVFELAIECARKLRPDIRWADLKFAPHQNRAETIHHFSNALFQDAFGIILPSWEDCVLECVTGFVSRLQN